MEENRKSIDDLFRDELSNYAETPPPAAWHALEQKLAGKAGGAGAPGNALKYMTLLCLLFLLGVTVMKNFPASTYSGSRNMASAENGHSGSPAANNVSNNAPNPGAGNISSSNNTDARNNEVNNNSNQNNNNNTSSATTPNTLTNDAAGHRADNSNKEGNAATGTSEKANRQASGNTGRKQHIVSKRYTGIKTHGNSKQGTAGMNDNDAEDRDQKPQRQNIYNSSLANPQPAETESDDATADKKPSEQTKKPQPVSKNNQIAPSKNAPKKSAKPHFNKFELGIKGGYESGFDNDGARKFVLSPYLQFNLSPKFAIMTQPAVKYAHADSRRIGSPASYYKANDGTVTQYTDSVLVFVPPVDSLWLWHNAYSQTHDSIVKTYSINNTYMELEVPLLLKYNISKTFSVYGGVNIIYSQLVSVDEKTTTHTGILVNDTTYSLGQVYGPAPAPGPIDNVIKYHGTPLADYNGPLYTGSKESTWRVGYMLGFSYEFRNRWLMDGLIQQASVKPNVQAGYNINTALSTPYFRFTIGYKLVK